MIRSTKGKRQPGAIPTTWANRTYRSRLEARVAQLLDMLGMSVRYEPDCWLLSDGECYIPDWQETGTHNFVEARGYCSAKGQGQIDEFIHLLPYGASYAVIRDEKAGGSVCWDLGQWSALHLHLVRPGYRLPVRCRESRVEFKLYGQWLSPVDLQAALVNERGTLEGARLHGA